MEEILFKIENLSKHIIFVLMGDKSKKSLALKFLEKTPLNRLYTLKLDYKDITCNIWDKDQSISMIPKNAVDAVILVCDMQDKGSLLKTREDFQYFLSVAEKEYNTKKIILLINLLKTDDVPLPVKLSMELKLKHYIIKSDLVDIIKSISCEIYKTRLERFNEDIKGLLISHQSQTRVC